MQFERRLAVFTVPQIISLILRRSEVARSNSLLGNHGPIITHASNPERSQKLMKSLTVSAQSSRSFWRGQFQNHVSFRWFPPAYCKRWSGLDWIGFVKHGLDL